MGFDDEKGNNQDIVYERIESTQTGKMVGSEFFEYRKYVLILNIYF